MPLAPVEAEENYIIKKLLVTGPSGFLAWNICQTAKKEWDIFGTVFSHHTKELKALRDII